ncbi:putative cysteine desulfurase [Zopfochytrium polystomum]|nr:putative cysteine desulfurase [Zopfochytrium polystomum]
MKPHCSDAQQQQQHDQQDQQQTDTLLADIRQQIIGRDALFRTPFGTTAQCYADYTASGRALECVEAFIQTNVLPTYGNTHTTTSITGLQTTALREEARQTIARAVNAWISGHGPGRRDVVLFAGHGCTGAVAKLITAMGLDRMPRSSLPSSRPAIFTCPFAHHSNLLPWRELLAADVVEIPEARPVRGNGFGALIDYAELEQQLVRFRGRKLKIGAFTAASNVTGALADVDRTTRLLHKHGALAFWDYAAAAPYVDIDMNPSGDPAASKDAVFFSGHKFVGGPGTPGVLIVKRDVLPRNAPPSAPGGGTVLFVTEKAHSYLANPVEREEGGTPDILGSIRLGLAIELKLRVGAARIAAIERDLVRRVRRSLAQNDHIVLLGHNDPSAPEHHHQLPIFSFMVRFGDRFLHHNFVCALLNDLFGVLSRGGCHCAGPYGARLLGLRRNHIVALGYAVVAGDEVLKPGATRVGVPYFADDADVQYLLDAVHFVATHGWRLLPDYRFDPRTGAWRHRAEPRGDGGGLMLLPAEKRLSALNLNSRAAFPPAAAEAFDLAAHRRENLRRAAVLADTCLADACLAAAVAAAAEPKRSRDDGHRQRIIPAHEWLRWFVYPDEAVAAQLECGGVKPPLAPAIKGPCQPQRYRDGSVLGEWNGVPSLGSLKRSFWGRLYLRLFMRAELDAMQDKRTDDWCG